MENWIKYFLGPAPATVTSSSCQSSQAESLSKDETSSPEAEEEDEEKNRRPKRSKFVDVRLPRNIMADPKDRTNTTPGQAMHLLSAVLKSAQRDGENLDLNEMFLSESTIRRGREKAREEISKQQYEDFQDKKPDYLAVHWEIIF